MDTATAWKKSHFILSDRLDFHMIDSLSITLPTLANYMLTSLSGDEILLPRYVIWSTNFRGLPLRMKIAHFHLKYMNSVLLAFTKRPMPPAACSKLCHKVSARNLANSLPEETVTTIMMFFKNNGLLI